MKILMYLYSLKSLGCHPQNYSMTFRREDRVKGNMTYNSRGVLYISQKGHVRNALHGSHTNPKSLEDIPLDELLHAAETN